MEILPDHINRSATGDLLPGYYYNFKRKYFSTPEYAAHVLVFEDTDQKLYAFGHLEVSQLSKYALYPIASTASGFYRSFLGLVHAVAHLGLVIFTSIGVLSGQRGERGCDCYEQCGHHLWEQSPEYHFEEMRFGLFHFLTGIYEMIPIIGNIITYYKKQTFLQNAVQEHIANYDNRRYQWTYFNMKYDVDGDDINNIYKGDQFRSFDHCPNKELVAKIKGNLGDQKYNEINQHYEKLERACNGKWDKGFEGIATGLRDLNRQAFGSNNDIEDDSPVHSII